MENEHTYIDGLIDDCRKAKEAVPTQAVQSLDDTEVFKGLKNAIYVFEEIGGDAGQTFERFCGFKDQRTRQCPRANSPSQILYVGSSVGKLESRLKQHVGNNNNKSTSALNLTHWFRGQYRITAKTYDVSPAVLQIIEDSLHHYLKPAFGKNGSNGK